MSDTKWKKLYSVSREDTRYCEIVGCLKLRMTAMFICSNGILEFSIIVMWEEPDLVRVNITDMNDWSEFTTSKEVVDSLEIDIESITREEFDLLRLNCAS